MVTSLNPADRPCFFAGYWRHQNPGTSSEVRCPVAQDHAGRLVDAGRVGVDGSVHLQYDDTVSETLGFTPDTLDTAHCIRLNSNTIHDNVQRSGGEERRMETARESPQLDPHHVLR